MSIITSIDEFFAKAAMNDDPSARISVNKTQWLEIRSRIGALPAKERREHIAAQLLAGFCACQRCHENSEYDAYHFVKNALEFADELITRLDK